MPKAKKSKIAKRKVVRSKRFVEYNSLTFLLFLVFVLLASFFLVIKLFTNY